MNILSLLFVIKAAAAVLETVVIPAVYGSVLESE
jgi:hypothetical protein